MSGKGLFGSTPIGAVTLVEAPVSQWYARRARVTVAVVGLVVDAVASAVASVFWPVLVALALGALAGVVCGLLAGVLVRVWPVLRVLWWWSFEITAVALVVAGWVALARPTAWWLASVALLAVGAGCLLAGPVRRFLSALSWCLLVRHRLRLCFTRIVRGVSFGAGPVAPLPLVLWARPTPAGERVWLWLRPGLELADLEDKTGRIAVTCLARQVRVLPASERFAALLRVDVTRRDPLTGKVPSPLALLVPSLRKSNQNVKSADVRVDPVPPVGLDLADIDEPPASQPSRGSRR